MDPTAERIAKNDVAFRDANERIERAAVGADFEQIPFLCECADPRCTAIVRLPIAEYERIRSSGRLFVNVDGHEVNGEGWARTVAEQDGHVIVEKVGDAAKLAEAANPRADARR